MQPKILLIALSVAAFTSCTTAYKSGQTPDDVYYSPVRPEDDDQRNNDKNQDVANNNAPEEDRTIRMRIRDHRWRDLDNDYSYSNSPYYYCTCSCNSNSYGYYYNPKYHPWPIYLTKVTPPNFTPRTVNLNSYTGYSNTVPVSPKAGNNTGINWIKPTYNTPGGSVFGNVIRQALTPSGSSSSSSSSNSTRTYSPSKDKSGSNSSSSSSGSSSSGSSGSSVARPKRG